MLFACQHSNQFSHRSNWSTRSCCWFFLLALNVCFELSGFRSFLLNLTSDLDFWCFVELFRLVCSEKERNGWIVGFSLSFKKVAALAGASLSFKLLPLVLALDCLALASVDALLNLLQWFESKLVCKPLSTEMYFIFFFSSFNRTKLLFVGGT